MIIDKLLTLNLEELYKACCLKQYEKSRDSKFEFKSGIINIYNHVELTFNMHDVSIYEYMLLKRYASRCTKLYNKTILYKSPDYSSELYEYAKLIHEITNDKDIINTRIKHDYPYLYGPSYLIRGECSVTLTGKRLISIFDIDPANTFLLATKGKCLSENGSITFNKEYNFSNGTEGASNRIEIENFITDKFIRAFYNSFFISSTTGSDLISDSSIHYYFSTHETPLELFSISNPIVNLNIRRDNLNKATDLISSAKSELDDNKVFMDEDVIYDDICMIFNLYTRFSTYMNLFENLPSNLFISEEDLKIPYNFKEIYIPIEFHQKYSEKLEDAYTSLNTYLDNEHKNFYVKYQCTYLNSMYAYSIKIKLDDVNKYINEVDSKELLPEAKNIIDEIIKYSRAVFNLFK